MDQVFDDKTLKCKDCGQDFIWSASEQEFFASKGFKNKPARCKDCRKQNRTRVESEFYKVTCANCKQAGDVLFQPNDPASQIYCKDCFDKIYRSSQV